MSYNINVIAYSGNTIVGRYPVNQIHVDEYKRITGLLTKIGYEDNMLAGVRVSVEFKLYVSSVQDMEELVNIKAGYGNIYNQDFLHGVFNELDAEKLFALCYEHSMRSEKGVL